MEGFSLEMGFHLSAFIGMLFGMSLWRTNTNIGVDPPRWDRKWYEYMSIGMINRHIKTGSET